MSNKHEFQTRVIHAGSQADPATKAQITPIYQTTSYVFDDVDHAARLFALQEFGNIYSRINNPTNDVLEKRLADLEGGTAALAVSSGHAAQLTTLHNLLKSGQNLVAAKQLYGGTINQFNHAFKQFGWNVHWADAKDNDSFKRAIDKNTRAIHIESIANPGGIITDIEAIARIAEQAHIPLIVDNTLASPYLIRPFEYGANIVLHSLTKFINGHANALGGIIIDGGNFNWSKDDRYPILKDPNQSYGGLEFHKALDNIAFAIVCRALSLRDLGACLSPFNAFLTLNGLQTLALRMQKQCDNALRLALFLRQQDAYVSWVSYAGLKDDPHYSLAQKYTPKGAGAVFTFGIKGGHEAGKKFVSNLKLLTHVANVGDLRSLVIHPSSTTHSQLTEEQKITAGAGPDVIRLSVGIENVEDIINDIQQAFENL